MPKGRGKSVALRLAASAGLGAAATVMVAWGTMRFARPERTIFQGERLEWGRVPSDWPAVSTGRVDATGRAVRSSIRSKLTEADAWTEVLYDYGWPVVALRSRYLDSMVRGVMQHDYPKFWAPAWFVPGWRRGLPMEPVLPGFALDTAFYAAIALTLWPAPGVIRRRLRRARGHCPACGYDLRGAPTVVCPECGA